MKRGALLLVSAIALLAGSGCRPAGPAHEETAVSKQAQPVYSAFKAGREVLRFKQGPGPITSKAATPPGAAPVIHPFVAAAALDPLEEDALRRVLEQSSGFEDFIARLRKAGYTVEKTDKGL